MSLENALANIPGYGAYIARRQMNEQQPMQELQQASGAMGLMGALQKQQTEAAFRQAMDGAKTPEEQLAAAVKFGGSEAVMRHADRQASVKATSEAAMARLQQQAQTATQNYQLGLQRVQNAQQRLALDTAYKGYMARLSAEAAKYNTGATVEPFQAPEVAPTAQPAAPQQGPQMFVDVPESDRAAYNLARSGVPASADRQVTSEEMGRMADVPAAPGQAPAPPPGASAPAVNVTGGLAEGLDANDMRARMAPTPAPAASPAPAEAPKPAPQMPTFTGSPKQQAEAKNRWLAAQGKSELNLTGGRESVYVQRMMMGANQASKDLSNVVQLPLTASTGFFGGRKQGAGLLDAAKEVLANKATQQEAQAYNAMATGFQRSLAQIESAGLMPSGSLTHQMDAVLFKEGDTNLTKLHKLAQTRQIVEAGMEVINANPRVSPGEKEKVQEILKSIRASVPFTHSDLIKLQVEQEKNPGATLRSTLKSGQGKWEVVR